ncbi:MAG: hypothetical protein CMG76_01195 [Candidatus Marinimicrobia bacterium]|nr:hypothetical protein [Candidatus Neomarinimicrobiota bacterium]|tara:strand:+ start:365 stop:2059 length:1695 start_codon:yes stop_codon:yes gene_type:complete
MILKIKLLFAGFCSLLFGYVINIDGASFDEQDFYSKYSKSEWIKSSAGQKDRILKDYVKRESASLAAEEEGFLFNPVLKNKLFNIQNQILINLVYDYTVAFPLISKESLALSRSNLKKEVFIRHLLISHNTSVISSPPSRNSKEALYLIKTIKDSLKSTESSFGYFSKTYSDDPSAPRNEGVLGWLQWGVTPMNFQSSVWSLNLGEVSDIIETEYGFHLVVVDSIRSSEFSIYDSDSYEYAVQRSSLVSVRDLLKDASLAYDREVLSERVIMYEKQVDILFNQMLESKKELLSLGQSFNFTDFIRNLNLSSVLFSVDGKLYGLKWFLPQVSQFPKSKIPDFTSSQELISFLQNIIMQKIAIKDGSEMGLVDNDYFKKRVGVEQSRILYDSYLKHLVNSIETPDSSSVEAYYNKNKKEKYFEPEKVVVRQIKVASKNLSDSLYVVLSSDDSLFGTLSSEFSLVYSQTEGLMDPFERGKFNYMGEAAFELDVGVISKPIENPDKSFSIIMVEEKIDKKIIPINRVYKRIESLLIKESQEKIKTTTFNNFINNPELKLGDKYEKFYN